MHILFINLFLKKKLTNVVCKINKHAIVYWHDNNFTNLLILYQHHLMLTKRIPSYSYPAFPCKLGITKEMDNLSGHKKHFKFQCIIDQ